MVVVEFSAFDSVLVLQGDMTSVKVDGRFAGGYAGLHYVAPKGDVAHIVESCEILSHSSENGFWAVVTIDDDGMVTTEQEHAYVARGSGYASARPLGKPRKEII